MFVDSVPRCLSGVFRWGFYRKRGCHVADFSLIRRLAAGAALLVGMHAHAVYVSADPPAGWRPAGGYSDGYARLIVGSFGGGGAMPTGGAPASYLTPNSPNVWPIRAQAPVLRDPVAEWLFRNAPGAEAQAFVPAAIYGAGVIVSTAVRVGGRSIMMPGFLKFAPTAGRAAAAQGFRGAAAGLFASMFAAAGLAWIWDEASKSWWKTADGVEPSSGLDFQADNAQGAPWHSSKSAACNAWVARYAPPGSNGYDASVASINGMYCRIKFVSRSSPSSVIWQDVSLRSRGSTCPIGWYVTPAGCLQSPPMVKVGEQEFTAAAEPLPWPDGLPEQLPDGVPVHPPVINPLPSPWDPSKPFKSPIGDPMPNPDFDPSKAPSPVNPPRIQPGVRIVPSPTVPDPWRTDVQPNNEPLQDGEETTNPKPDPTKGPQDPASAPSPSGSKPNVPDKQPGLCELFPNISACQPLGGAPAPQPLPNQEKAVSITPESGFGPSDGTCPAPRVIKTQFLDVTLPWDLVCDFARMLRPLVIAMAWLGAALTFFGIGKGS